MAAGHDTQPDPAGAQDAGEPASLLDDLGDLMGDAQTWFEAELSYQKLRAAFVGANLKQAAVAGLAAVVLLVVAVMGLTFGLVLALTPLVTAWGATAIVVGVLLLGALWSVSAARRAWGEVLSAIAERADDESGGRP